MALSPGQISVAKQVSSYRTSNPAELERIYNRYQNERVEAKDARLTTARAKQEAALSYTPTSIRTGQNFQAASTASGGGGYTPLTDMQLSSESRFSGGLQPYTFTRPNRPGEYEATPEGQRQAKLLKEFQAQQDAANKANESRYQQGLEIYDRIASTFAEGGAFENAALAELDRTKSRDIASLQAGLAQAGLANTTRFATIAKKYEEDVGVPTRLGIRAAASDRLAGALGQKAGFIERREDIGPDFATVASLYGN